MKQRIFAAVAGAALLAVSSCSFAADGFNPAKPVMTKLKDGVYQYSQFFYNSLVVISDDGVLITDPSGAKRAADMRAAIRELTDQPITDVVYSHDHFDHSRGGQIFKAEGARFITQQGCLELLSRDLDNQVIAPDITYSTKYTVSMGDKQVDLNYYGPNDGACMSVIHIPQDKVLLAVDWHLPRYVNEGYRLPEHDYVGILNTFRKVSAELEFDTVISGHAPQSSPELFAEDHRFVEALFKAVREGMLAGKSTQELKQSIRLPEFAHWRGYQENLPAHVERMAYSIWHGN